MNNDQFQLLVTMIQNLDKKVDDFKTDVNKRFDEARQDRQAIRDEMQRGFDEARHDRQAIRDEMQRGFDEARQDRQAIRDEMQRGFDEAREERHELRTDMRIVQQDIKELYKSRHEVEYKITRDFIIKNLMWNMSIVAVALILGKLILL